MRILLRIRLFPAMAVLILVYAVQVALLINDTHHRDAMAQAAMNAELLRNAAAAATPVEQLMNGKIAQFKVLHRIGGELELALEADDTARAAELRRTLADAIDMAGAMVFQVAGTDITGHVTWSSLPMTLPGPDLRDREHIMAILHDAQNEFVGRPVVGRVSNLTTVQFTAAVHDAAGALHGASVVSVDAALLLDLAKQVKLSSNDRMLLLRGDGMILMDSLLNANGTQVATDMTIYRDALRTGYAQAQHRSYRDGRTRQWDARRLSGTDLVIAVGVDVADATSQSDALRDVDWQHVTLLCLAWGLVALLACGALVLLRTLALRSTAAAALAHSEARFRMLADNIQDAVLLCEPSMQIRYASPSTQRLLGVAPDALTSQHLTAFIDPQDAAQVVAFATDRRQRDHDGGITFRMLHASGALIWVWAETSRVDGAVWGAADLVLISLRDETLRHAQASEIAEARAMLSQVVELAPGTLYRGTVLPDLTLRIDYVAENASLLFGTRAGEVFGPAGLIMHHPHWVQSRTEYLAQATHEDEFSLRLRVRLPDGQSRALYDCFRVVRLPDGGRQVIGFLTDITREEAAKAALQQAELQLHNLTTVAPGLLFSAQMHTDPQANPRITVQAVYGDIARVLRVRHGLDGGAGFLAACLAAAPAEEQARAVDQIDMTGESIIDVKLPQDADGQSAEPTTAGAHWLRLKMRGLRNDNSMPTLDDDGQVIRLVGYAMDVTAEKAAEQVMRETSRLVTLGEMATGMAHEMNQPLASISMAAENLVDMLDDQPLPIERLRQKLRKIAAEALRAGRVMEHMRVFARASPPSAQIGQVMLAEVVHNAAGMLDMRLRLANVALTIDLPADLPPVRARAIPLEQVLINLIANAADAYGQSRLNSPPRRVTIRARQRGDRLVLNVIDQAGGIPDAVCKHLFEPFFTTKEPGKGTGLGLSICWSIVTEMQGTISVINHDGGAVFEVVLPLVGSASGALLPNS